MRAPIDEACPARISWRPDAEHDEDRDVADERREGEVDGRDLERAQPGVAVAGGEAEEVPRVAGLAPERLGDPDPRDVLLQVGVDRRDAVALAVIGAGRLDPEPHGADARAAARR